MIDKDRVTPQIDKKGEANRDKIQKLKAEVKTL